MQIGDDRGDEWHSRAFTVAFMCSALQELLKVVTNKELRGAGINPVMQRTEVRGKPTNWPYCGQCLHCGAPQDNYHVGEEVRKALYHSDGVGNLTSLVPFNRYSVSKGLWVFEAIAPC